MIDFKFNGQTYSALFPELLRPLTFEEGRDLEQSIRASGVQAPVLVDEDAGVIDGLHRCTIAERLGIADVPTRVITGLSDDQKRQLAFDLNDCRRQQNAHELGARRRAKQAIVEAVKEDPAASTPAIAEAVEKKTGRKPDHKTVAKVKEHLGNSGEIPKVPTQGRDGKTYRPRKSPGVQVVQDALADEVAPPTEETPAAEEAAGPPPPPKPKRKAFDAAGFKLRLRPVHGQLAMLVGSLGLMLSDVGSPDLLLGRLEGARGQLPGLQTLLEEVIQWQRQNWPPPAQPS